MTESENPIEDRDANVRLTVSLVIQNGLDKIYADLDQLHKRNIHDGDIVKALRDMNEMDLLEGYADWAEIDLREDDNTTLDPTVPDPRDDPSYKGLAEHLKAVKDAASPALDTPALDRLQQAMKGAGPVTFSKGYTK